jgi:hypothetical protein
MKNSTDNAASGSDSAQSQSYPGKGNMGVGGKEKSSKSSGFGVKGGVGNHMLSGMTAGPQVPGQSASEGKGGGKYATGGSSSDVPRQFANSQEAGVAGHATGSSDQKFAVGGKGPDNHMFGKTGSQPAKPA